MTVLYATLVITGPKHVFPVPMPTVDIIHVKILKFNLTIAATDKAKHFKFYCDSALFSQRLSFLWFGGYLTTLYGP
jgi:hypothetical protein